MGTAAVGSSAAPAAQEPAPKTDKEKPSGEGAAKLSSEGVAAAGDKKNDEKTEAEAEKEEKPEPTEDILSNPCRVLKAQRQYISFPAEIHGQPVRYTPLLGGNRRVGFLLLQDNRPEEAEDLFLEDDKPAEDDGEKEPEPP